MDLIYNFPAFTVLLSLLCSGIGYAVKDKKKAKVLSLCLLTTCLILNTCTLFYCIKNGSFTYMMGHFPAPWGNEIRAGLCECLMALSFNAVLIFSIIGGYQEIVMDIDNNKAVSLGLSLSDVTDTLSSAWGGTYVNDFIDRGRVKKVYIQGDSDYRAVPSDLNKWYVRGSDSTMTPFSAFATTRWEYGPESLVRYNGSAAYEIQGENASGASSGTAMSKMEQLANNLPSGSTWAWSGLSLQEKLASGQAMSLYALSILVVFLCLAALYESWSVPISVILVIPLGVLGAAIAASLRGLSNDVYFQVALLTTIGLSSKNAILIVEFAEAKVAEGYSLTRAALRAAQTRLRPIIMTSLAFIAGVTPLAIATGAGANSRVAIGTGIIGGTLAATLLAIFFVPLFFVLVKRLFSGKHANRRS